MNTWQTPKSWKQLLTALAAGAMLEVKWIDAALDSSTIYFRQCQLKEKIKGGCIITIGQDKILTVMDLKSLRFKNKEKQ